VTNSGPSTATAATLTETTPANTNVFLHRYALARWSCTTPAVGSAGNHHLQQSQLAAGSASFSIALAVTAGTAAGTAINDIAFVSSSTPDPNSANNAATAADVVSSRHPGRLSLNRIRPPNFPVAPVVMFTYSQSVTNNGPASATTVSFTQTTPPNTNFNPSQLQPAGLAPLRESGPLALSPALLPRWRSMATASFTLVLQVNAGTASGTNIAETAAATASNIVPSITSNTATAAVVVANAGSANVTIVKTATPGPTVAEGDTITYSLVVTNNGPHPPTNVTVTDPLPADVTYYPRHHECR